MPFFCSQYSGINLLEKHASGGGGVLCFIDAFYYVYRQQRNDVIKTIYCCKAS